MYIEQPKDMRKKGKIRRNFQDGVDDDEVVLLILRSYLILCVIY